MERDGEEVEVQLEQRGLVFAGILDIRRSAKQSIVNTKNKKLTRNREAARRFML